MQPRFGLPIKYNGIPNERVRVALDVRFTTGLTSDFLGPVDLDGLQQR
jgi:hypothetical protein